MSDHFLRLIPRDPEFVPEPADQATARLLLVAAFPKADIVIAKVLEGAQFIDQGGNFERVLCSACGMECTAEWWHDAMDAAFDPKKRCFADLTVAMPCCGVTTSLNDLRYEWPAGFARFVLEAKNPDGDATPSQILMLERTLKCPLRKIRAKY